MKPLANAFVTAKQRMIRVKVFCVNSEEFKFGYDLPGTAFLQANALVMQIIHYAERRMKQRDVKVPPLLQASNVNLLFEAYLAATKIEVVLVCLQPNKSGGDRTIRVRIQFFGIVQDRCLGECESELCSCNYDVSVFGHVTTNESWWIRSDIGSYGTRYPGEDIPTRFAWMLKPFATQPLPQAA
jgi:hypothetical protein